MSAHVLLNLLNELRNLVFRNKLNKFSNTGARMLDSIYHMTLKLFLNHILGMKTLGFCHMRDVKSIIHNSYPKICKPLVVY